MLQDIRKHTQGTAAKVIIGLIVISFAIFGIESILVSGGGNDIAEVNGEKISPQELQSAIDTQRRRLMAMMGDNIDFSQLQDDKLSGQVLESLISRKLLTQAASEMQLSASDAQVATIVSQMGQFQQAGTFSPELYRQVLSDLGYTPGSFKQALKEDLQLNQQRMGLFASEFSTADELEVSARLEGELRDFEYLTLSRQQYLPDIDVSDAQIQEYYDQNPQQFTTPEQLDLDYIELTAADFDTPVDEAELMEAFEASRHEFTVPPQSRVSHILIAGDDAQQTRQRVAEVQQAIAGGAEFAELARQYSDDPGSSQKGGDLGVTSGNAFPKAMEDAIATLDVGAISEPVKTDSGTHLILLSERTEGKSPAFEEVRSQLEASIRASKASGELLVAVDRLRDLSFNAEDLSGPASELGLKVQLAQEISRQSRSGVFANEAVLDAAFSDDVLLAGHNSEVIEIAENHYIVLHLRKHIEPALVPIAQVRATIAADLREHLATKRARDTAGDLVSQLRAGASPAELASAVEQTWKVEIGVDRGFQAVDPRVLDRVFTLPAPEDGAVSDWIETPAGDIVVLRLTRSTPGELDAFTGEKYKMLHNATMSEIAALADMDFRGRLRQDAKVTVMQ